ncbi:MAG: CapA family protein [Candidatus Heteroscillospira sp.]|jgi:poly-gamma-glutamate capsule biosynthesis protein CapA/YwtB (metallophosphatase superfamily)
MRKLIDGVMYVVLVVLVVILGVIVLRNYSLRDVPGKEETTVLNPGEAPKVNFPSMDDKYVPEAGENAFSVNLAVAGDIVCHTGLNDEAYDGEKDVYDYSAIFADAAGILSAADYSAACLETTFPDTKEYTGFPLFCSPEALAASLRGAGLDLISTASNHALDGYVGGLRRTLDVLEKNELAHVGTYRSQEERDENSGVTVADIGGVKVAFLAYAYGTNGVSNNGHDYSVNVYHENIMDGSGEIRYDMIENDMAYARGLEPDIVAVFMHWGDEYAVEPNAEQNELADFLFKEGADIILGGHTHVPEPMELREFEDKYGEKKTGFIVYSLGNFVSCQNDERTNLTAVLNIELTKDPDSGESWVSGVGYTPMFMVDLEDYGVSSSEAGWHYRLWDLHKTLDGYAAGDDRGVINESLAAAMKEGLEEIHNILGRDFDLYYLDEKAE